MTKKLSPKSSRLSVMFSKVASATFVAVTLLISAAACAAVQAQAAPVTVEHELGTTVVDVNPQRVVVFDFGALDSLDVLGIDVVGLPKGNIPSYLSKYNDAKYINVGTLQEPDYEAVNALKPDLIIISSRTAAHYDELSRLAPTVYVGVNFDDYLGSVKYNLRMLGRIFGAEDKVEAELARIDTAIARVRAVGRGSHRPCAAHDRRPRQRLRSRLSLRVHPRRVRLGPRRRCHRRVDPWPGHFVGVRAHA